MLLEVETVHELEGAWWAFALKAARRASVSALCCAMRRRFSSGVTLVSPRGCRVNGLPISNGGWGPGQIRPHRYPNIGFARAWSEGPSLLFVILQNHVK